MNRGAVIRVATTAVVAVVLLTSCGESPLRGIGARSQSWVDAGAPTTVQGTVRRDLPIHATSRADWANDRYGSPSAQANVNAVLRRVWNRREAGEEYLQASRFEIARVSEGARVPHSPPRRRDLCHQPVGVHRRWQDGRPLARRVRSVDHSSLQPEPNRGPERGAQRHAALPFRRIGRGRRWVQSLHRQGDRKLRPDPSRGPPSLGAQAIRWGRRSCGRKVPTGTSSSTVTRSNRWWHGPWRWGWHRSTAPSRPSPTSPGCCSEPARPKQADRTGCSLGKGVGPITWPGFPRRVHHLPRRVVHLPECRRRRRAAQAGPGALAARLRVRASLPPVARRGASDDLRDLAPLGDSPRPFASVGGRRHPSGRHPASHPARGGHDRRPLRQRPDRRDPAMALGTRR